MDTAIEQIQSGRENLAELARRLFGVDIGAVPPQQREKIVRDLTQLGYDTENVGELAQENSKTVHKNMQEIEQMVGPATNSLPNLTTQTKAFNLKRAQMMPPQNTAPPAGATDAPPPPGGAGGGQPDALSFTDGSDVKDFLDQIGDPNQAISMLGDQFSNENSQVTDPATQQTGSSLQLIKDAVNDFYSTSDEQAQLDAASTLFQTIVPDAQKTQENPMDEGAVPAEYHKNPVGIAAAVLQSNQAVKKLAQQNAHKAGPFNLSKQAQHKTIENVILHGPGETHVDQFLGHHISDWHLIERNKGFGLKLPGLLNLDWEKVWRSTIMDKYTPNYIEDRFEVDKNIPPANNLHLKPGEFRRTTPNEFGLTEARLEDGRTKMNEERGYAPSSKGEPFNWKKAQSGQNTKTALTPSEAAVELKEILSQLLLVEKMAFVDAVKVIEAKGHLHECGKCYKWKKCKCKEASEVPMSHTEEVEDSVQAASQSEKMNYHPCGKCKKNIPCTCEPKTAKMVDPIKRCLPYNASSGKKKVITAEGSGGQVGSGLKPLPELKLPGEKSINTNTLKKCPRCQGDLAPPHNYCPNCKTGFPGAVDTGQVRTGPAPQGVQPQQGAFIQPNQQLRAASVDVADSNDGGIFFDGKSFVCYAKKKKHKFDTYEDAEKFKQVKKVDPQKDPAGYLMRQREKEPLDFKQLPASSQVNPATIQHATPQMLQNELLKKKRMQNMPSDPTCRVHDHAVADNLGIEG